MDQGDWWEMAERFIDHRLAGLYDAAQSHRTRSFKLSNDPFVVEKVRDIAGLYLNPPDHALVLCVDEKCQILSIEPSRFYRWDWATSKASPTITFATERPR